MIHILPLTVIACLCYFTTIRSDDIKGNSPGFLIRIICTNKLPGEEFLSACMKGNLYSATEKEMSHEKNEIQP